MFDFSFEHGWDELHVALVCHYFSPHIGGVETLVAEQAKGLVARGCTVEILTSRLREDPATDSRDGVLVRRFRSIDVLSRINVPVPLVSPRMISQIREGGYDVVVAHGHCYMSSVYVALASRVPFILWQSNPFVEYGIVLNLVQRVVDMTLGSWVAARAERVVAVSEHVAKYVATFRKGQVQVIYPGVDTALFQPEPPRRREQGERVIVRTLRRLVPRQGVDILVMAWSSIGLGDEAVLEIGGRGPERRALEALAAGDDSISFRGRIPNEELVEFYKGCDLFVLPTYSGEGYGLVVAEAMSCGRPVVATRSGGPAELVRDGVDGLLVPPGDVSELGRAILELVRDRVKRESMARAAGAKDLLLRDQGYDDTVRLLREAVGIH